MPVRARFAALAPAPLPAAAADDPVVIVGMSGVFPMADDIDQFWANLRDGRDCMSEIPPDRWDWREHYGDPTKEENKTNIKSGGFISGVDHFDPLFFGISPKEAEAMDPQQRLLMLHVWNCIEDAGQAPASLAGTRTAVLVGTGPTGYIELMTRANIAIEGYTITGGVQSVGPNRMSYLLDLRGPSEPVETACSSALVALHRGVQAIDNGECDMAIVGGVNTLVSPHPHISFSKAGMLSVDGRCKTFSDKADGYARGEGVGMLLLKRQSAAERDGNHIYAVIRGTAENHGGRANSLTAPNPKAQADLIKTAFQRAGIDPRTVGYMEAHGTGTPLGDPVEVNGLKMAFRDLYAASGSAVVADAHCGIGSVKTNIGHLEMAAGAAGVIKVLLQMRHRMLVPSLHAETLNPYIALKGSPFYVVREAREWTAPRAADGSILPRRAGVSSFGFGGVNAHVVLEEYVAKAAPRAPLVVSEQAPVLLVLSARNTDRLQDRLRQLRAAIADGVVTADTLADAAYTLQVGREAMDARLAMVASSVEDLAGKLDALLGGDDVADDVHRGEARRHKQEMALFASDEDAMHMLDAWLDKGKYDKLLELWVKGLHFDWTRLYTQGQPRRLSLPAYPFAKDRYWVRTPERAGEGAANGATAPVTLHPLLHNNTSTLAEQRFTTRFSGHERFLTDHLVQGRKMLPGVAHLEMARTALAAALGTGGDGVGGLHLNNVVFSRPIVVEDDGLEVHVGVTTDANGALGYELYGHDASSGARVVYSQGAATLADAGASRIDLAAVQSACTRDTIPAAAFYPLFRAKGLDLGPGLQAIETVYVGVDQVLARLRMPPAVLAERGRYLLHPSMLDAAVTTPVALALSTAADGGLALPFALQALEVLGPCEETMWVLARPSTGSSPADKVQKFDLDLCNDEGLVCVRFKALSVRVVDSASAAAPATMLLQPVWHDAAPAQVALPAPDDWCVLLCGSTVAPAALGARLGARCDALPDDFLAQTQYLLKRLQELLAARPQTPLLVQLVIPRSGPLQASAGLAGLLSTARLEHPGFIGQVITVECDDDGDDAVGRLAARLAENRHCPDDVRIRYTGDTRQVAGWSELADAPATQPWRAGGVYLITGGLGALGRIFAKEIAARAPGAVLVLTGRRQLDAAADDGARLAIGDIEALGARVEYHALDIADRDATQRLVRQVHERHGALHGIVHSAGVLRDGLLLGKTPDAVREVCAAKVGGLLNLDEASADMALDWLICFSSISAVRGNIGQADYAAANGFMDGYVAYRNALAQGGQRSGRALSVNWPLWQDGGMQLAAAAVQAMERASGLIPLRTSSGIEALYRAMANGCEQVLVMQGQPARIRQDRAGSAAPAVTAAAAKPSSAAAPAAEDDSPAAQILKLLVAIVSSQAGVKPEAIKGDSELHEYGFDSIMLTELGNRINDEFVLDLAPTIFFEYPTLNELATFLSRRYLAKFRARLALAAPVPAPAAPVAIPMLNAPQLPRQSRLPAALASVGVHTAAAAADGLAEPVAIIGLSGRFPQADDLEQLWDNLRQGRDCVTEVPADRWDMAAFYDPQKGRAGKSYAKWGGFIDGIDEFDALFFHISPREAQALDPQARLFLQTVWSLFEGSGHTRASLQQRYQGRVGVYVGAVAQQAEAGADDDAIASLPVPSAIANRISHFFNFEGPSIAIDTMCSSAMMAIHLACRDLQHGECALAVAGGVNLSLSPHKYVGLSQVQLIGSHADSRSFTDGDGHLPAETVGALLLKPLRKAIADGDPILAVIKGTATQHSGRSNGYAVPNPKAQSKVMLECLRRAGATPDSVGWVEAAAAGSALSDAIEMTALGNVFEAVGASGRKVPVGAVKSHIGHPEVASAIAQVAKVVLQLKHRQLLPILPIGTPNRQLRMDDLALALQREPAAWEALTAPDGALLPRRALINSFAAGGTYVSAVIEEYVPPVPSSPPDGGQDDPGRQAHEPQLFVLSARDDERLAALLARSLQQLESHAVPDLRALAHTLQSGREAMDSRIAIIAATGEALRAGLRASVEGQDLNGLPVYRSGPGSAQASMAAETPADDVLAAWVAQRELDKLAQCWVRGGTVPWQGLHAGSEVRRLAWATYPFARQRYPIGYGHGSTPAHGPLTAVAMPTGAAAAVRDGERADVASVVLEAVAEALGIAVQQMPLDKPLQTLGYNSIAALDLKYRLEAALRQPLGLELLSDVRLTPAALGRQLAALLAQQPDAGPAVAPAAALPVLEERPHERLEAFPLTDMQEAFLLGRRAALDADRVGALIYIEIEVAGKLDIFRLNGAWNRLIARHDMLRATFIGTTGQRVVAQQRDYRFKVVDLRRAGAAERQTRAGQMRASMTERVFEGHEWPLFDIRVAIHGEDRYRIHFSIDELIVD
ncbi:SDR family NAD(P)-dependent oxidoreductase, partial [Janthinobacterium sp.]|uniref:SDR family NAD(P)-dependent oxidoreductase n=1 Tax=Janthinobacterium sp. TaxID=1871054 RepID=UPI002587592D